MKIRPIKPLKIPPKDQLFALYADALKTVHELKAKLKQIEEIAKGHDDQKQ